MRHTSGKLMGCITGLFLVLCVALVPATAQAQDMYRMYNPNSGEHFYTANTSERDDLYVAGWNYEGIGWVAPDYSSTPVYRLYSGTDHHYTTDASERAWLISMGWKDEGIGWYSDDAQSVPLYRQFNPNVNPSAPRNNSGSHNYTTSKAENDSLASIGWRAEGVGWYAVAGGHDDPYWVAPARPAQDSHTTDGSGSSGSDSGSGSSVANGDTVYVSTGSGTKYHKSPSCRSLRRSGTRAMSLAEAQDEGYTPCKNCYH